MEEIHLEMVETRDQLLRLLTGRRALEGGPEQQEAALEALDLLARLEGWLKSCAGQVLPVAPAVAFEQLRHRALVLKHVAPVLALLVAQGFIKGQQPQGAAVGLGEAR